MRALRVHGEREIRVDEISEPGSPGPREALIQIECATLNHLDVFGFRGMPFAKRSFPVITGVEGAGIVLAKGAEVANVTLGDRVVVYGGLPCFVCDSCVAGLENRCPNVGGLMGFHTDGVAAERAVFPAGNLVVIPDGLPFRDAVCATTTFGTSEHMLVDQANLQSGETILIHAGGSGIGSAAIRLAKEIGATVYTTVGGEHKVGQARSIGADFVIDHTQHRFDREVRRLTRKRGVDVVFEHVGADTWEGSLMSLARCGRLVTCGSSSGTYGKTNLYLLFNRQLSILASFGCNMNNVRSVLGKMSRGEVRPVIDSEIPLADWEKGLARLEGRQVFGKIIVWI